MTNKEKEQYLSNMMIFRSQPFLCELMGKRDFFNQMPKILYKYRSFDKYTKEMLEEPYVFLAPVKDLDDPFDCLTNPGVEPDQKDNIDSIGLSMLDYVIDIVCSLGNTKINRKEVKKIIPKCYVNGEYNEDNAREAFRETTLIPAEQKEMLLAVLRNLDSVTETIVKDKSMENLAKISIDPSDKVGICSLSTKRDNKVMWSLYGKKYKGYCVEYEIPNDEEIRFNLCPTIYKRNDDNNLIRKMVKLGIANCIRFMSEGELNRGIGCMNELFCTKDTDWQYQDEWRLIGNAKAHCTKLKVKAVYVGFKATDNNLLKIKRIAKKKGFKVFLMNAPKGKKKITYSEIKWKK